MPVRLRFASLLLGWFAVVLPTPAEDPAPRYAAAVKVLRAWIEKEVAAKRIPALSIALVDDQETVWAEGFGHEDADRKHAAGPHTLYRVGSVSKPIAALLLMLYVERGLIDLDVPIEQYLPDFRPVNKTGKPITLRQMLSHRSGLVRESPVGSYFDATGPSLADTVMSLNRTELIYTPETMTSYSNAAASVSGLLLQRREKTPFAELMRRKVFEPLGMMESSFASAADAHARLPHALMWTYHGREFAAPVFELGTLPAGNCYSTVLDQARLLRFLVAGGRGPTGEVMKAETLQKMWNIQFAKEGDKAGFGLGFFVSEFEGKRRIGHGGAVYGFATEFAALPDDKLGVIVCSARDVSNGLTRRISDVALRHLLAVRAGKPLPAIEATTPLDVESAKSIEGVYRDGDRTFEVVRHGGRVWAWPPKSGAKIEIRRLDDTFVYDDAMAFGIPFTVKGDVLFRGKESFKKASPPAPAPVPAKWEGLIGEYGPDHNTLTILEKDGALQALIEWDFLYPLREVSENVFAFPDFGMYHGDKIVFHRDRSGRATTVDAANVRFERRSLPRPGETFKITPLRPVEELRATALAADPPRENNALLRKPELADVTKLDPTIKLDIRYASIDNFLGVPLYTSARAFLQRPAAEALLRAHQRLQKGGYGLLIHDAYRPWFVTRMFRDAVPPRYYHFVADPLQGSRHNRGCAVDLTLYDLRTGKAVQMVGGYDEFSDRSYPDYVGGTSEQRAHRERLREAMEDEGFTVYEAEWWHFDYRDWRHYPILNLAFEQIP